ncbi:MAG: TM1812 family CRISPR-associated protein [Huintestinicola sp.]
MSEILIVYISVIQAKEPAVMEYDISSIAGCGKKTVRGLQTNEAATKCLIDCLREKNKRLDKIICIVTDKARNEKNEKLGVSAYDYYKNAVSEEAGYPVEFIDIDIRDGSFDSSHLINKITEKISTDDNVYIDTTGGQRNVVYFIQLLTRFLSFRGIDNPISFYTDFAGKKVIDAKVSDELTEIIDAVNQFVNAGSCQLLQDIFAENCPDDISELLQSISDFSDCIQLCDTSSLDGILRKMAASINDVRSISTADPKVALFKETIPVIAEKFNIDLESSRFEADYPAIISWCLSNGFVQQALTIYTEKIPGYLFEKGHIKANDAFIADKISSKLGTDKYAKFFYEYIMSPQPPRSDPEVDELKQHIELGAMFKPKSKNAEAVLNGIRELERLPQESFAALMNNSKKVKVSSMAYDIVTEVKKSVSPKSASGLKNSLKSNNNTMRILLDKAAGVTTASLPKKDCSTIEKKMITAKNTTDPKFFDRMYNDPSEDFSLKISPQDLSRIMYDYIYAKACRNKINHASSNENLTAEQWSELEKAGFSVHSEDGVFNLTKSDLKTNLSAMTDRIRNLSADK